MAVKLLSAMIVITSVLFLTDVRHLLLWLVVITDIDVDSDIGSVVFAFCKFVCV